MQSYGQSPLHTHLHLPEFIFLMAGMGKCKRACKLVQEKEIFKNAPNLNKKTIENSADNRTLPTDTKDKSTGANIGFA